MGGFVMPEYALWGFVVALVMLCLVLHEKIRDIRKRCKSLNNVLQDKDKELTETKKKQEEKIIELTTKVTELEKKVAEYEKEKAQRRYNEFNRPLNLAENPG
jgi:sensor histidine kinase YesM